MSIPNEALQKLLQEIEQKAAFSQQQIQIVKGQIAAKNRETRMTKLTLEEINTLPNDTKVYEGVGKMFILKSPTEVKSRLEAETKEFATDSENLTKKLNYLETTYRNSQEHIEKLFKSGQS